MSIFKIAHILKAYINYFHNKQPVYSTNKKVIVVRGLDSRIYKRYFYTFIKFFALAGYSIYFPDIDFKYFRFNIYKKKSNLYRLLYEEDKLITYGKPPKTANIHLTITDELLSPDYFSATFFENSNPLASSFTVPMAMHPLMYRNNLWDSTLNNETKKKKSIFMVGTLIHPGYSKIKTTPFKIESRTETYLLLKEKGILKEINSIKELKNFIASEEDKRCIILNSEKVPIDISELRNTLNSFRFYLALPGVFMPLSHNIIEAMSTGSIPILNTQYARFLTPELVHMQNAIIYKSHEDLELQIKKAYEIDVATLKRMSNNVLTYYELHLTPKAVVSKLISKKHNTIYLQAEQLSVEILEENFKKHNINVQKKD